MTIIGWMLSRMILMRFLAFLIGITGFVDQAGTIAGPDTNPHYWNMLSERPVLSFGARLRNAWRELIR
jgi:hypothetical protein